MQAVGTDVTTALTFDIDSTIFLMSKSRRMWGFPYLHNIFMWLVLNLMLDPY